jgi:hypothetical protein
MADGLITVDELREIFDIDPGISEKRFERHLVAAGREMRTWVGDEAYDDALAAVPNDETRAEALALAEAHLAMRFAIVGLNSPLRPTGVVSEERVEGNTLVRYLTPKQIAELKEEYLETAQSIAQVYLVVDESDEPFGAVVGGSDSNCEAVTRTCG